MQGQLVLQQKDQEANHHQEEENKIFNTQTQPLLAGGAFLFNE
jgi:hypothetical protein